MLASVIKRCGWRAISLPSIDNNACRITAKNANGSVSINNEGPCKKEYSENDTNSMDIDTPMMNIALSGV